MSTHKHPLLEVLQSRDPQLAEQAQRVIREAHRVIEYTLSTFPGGTDHTLRHTTTVEVIGRMLLPEAFLAELTKEELFFLVVSCHYHDLAMAGTVEDDESTETREQVRRDHALRIGNKVKEKWPELGFEDERTAEVLGEICRGHRPKRNTDGEATWEELNEFEVIGPGVHVRVRLVAALIYAIDELHLGADRAPERVEDWREIRDDESRRHWQRHRAVSGPTAAGGRLVFQVTCLTPGFEENLRAKVFRKALGGMNELGIQAVADGVRTPLPRLAVQWKRVDIWNLLLPVCCGDLVPRSASEIEQLLLEKYTSLTSKQTDLSVLCDEIGISEADQRASIGRCISDAKAYRQLVQEKGLATGHLVLSTEEKIADQMLKRMRDADEVDQLFLGKYCPSWESKLFDSEFGKAYINKCVIPAIDSSYSVHLALQPHDDPVKVLVERSPTATRLVRDYRPLPNNFVKEVLLRKAVMAGVLFDLHADPTRILDRMLREAVRKLAEEDKAVSDTIRLIEELALVGGFSTEQVTAAQSVSDAARIAVEEELPKEPKGFTFTIRQQAPVDAPAMMGHLPNLILASRRSETAILLTKAPSFDLDLQFDPSGNVPPFDKPPVMVGLGPVKSPEGFSRHRPAKMEISKPSRTIRFVLAQFEKDKSVSELPFVLRLPLPPSSGRLADAETLFNMTIQVPQLTIRDLRSIDTASQLIRTGSTQVEFIDPSGTLLASMITSDREDPFANFAWMPEAMRGLRGQDGNTPAPWFTPLEQLTEAGRMGASQRHTWWQEYLQQQRLSLRTITSIHLRLADAEGNPVEERFLRFMSNRMFQAPQVKPGGAMSQEQINRDWECGELDFALTCYFAEDIFELSDALVRWADRKEKDFPFKFDFDQNSPPLPIVRSALTVYSHRAVDRTWYRDFPMVFEFRPISRAEAYKLEANYWRGIGEAARAELADEVGERYAHVSPGSLRPLRSDS